jgi:O-acetyl-ADP-ribose deacetylase (regulator of RNase III)
MMPHLPFGTALVTPAFKLPNKFVIHTRAAHYLNDDEPEVVLAQCVYSVVDAANKNAITGIAIPAIGTGVFKFPKELAVEIMAKAFLACAAAPSSLQIVQICVAYADTERVFKAVFFGG